MIKVILAIGLVVVMYVAFVINTVAKKIKEAE